jgi:probable O-glycosylation ligase (exosortase A-associated)
LKGLLFTYLMTYGGAAVSLFNPFVGLLVYICFTIISPPRLWFWEVPQGNYIRTVALALLAGWLMKGCGNWRLGQAWGMALAITVYWLWTAVSWGWAVNAELASTQVDLVTKIVVPLLVGLSTIDSVKKVKQLVWVIVLSQGYLAYEFNLSYFSGYNMLREEGFGMDNNSAAIGLVTGLGLALFLSLESRLWWQKGFALLTSLLMAHAVCFSFSRGGMLALVVTGLVVFWLMPKRPLNVVLFLAAVVVAERLTGPEAIARFATTFATGEQRDGSAESRLELWDACLDLLKKYPQGIGPDQFGEYVPNYGFPRGKQAHTVWLQVAVEVGLPGVAGLLLYYLLCIKRLLPLARGRRPAPDPWLTVAARMVVTSLIGYMLAAQFVSLKNLEIPYFVGLVGAGVLKMMSQLEAAGPAGLPPAGSAGAAPFGPGAHPAGAF